MNRSIATSLILAASPWLGGVANAQQMDHHPEAGSLRTAGTAIVIRVPSNYLSMTMLREFEHSSPVKQEILGTKSLGTATCTGTITCEVQENSEEIAFDCCVSGHVATKSTGTNGPATIHSEAVTKYTARKPIVFDGWRLTCSPAVVHCSTELRITGIDSSLPLLGNKLVRKFAARKSEELRPQAAKIVETLTRSELQQRIDSDIACQVELINKQLREKLAILHLFPALRQYIHVCSSKTGFEIVLGDKSHHRDVVQVTRKPIGEAVEVWFQPDTQFFSKAPATVSILNTAANWLATSF